ncbi:MAG: SGNH/GDSL hydrolase family protein [Lewinellaceae bacterium]|nr:SGNH/GDSL hydrolase family protein [Lewinellaceae bacterium]
MKKPVRIAVIGSSTAAGQGAEPPEKAWVNRYRAYLKSLHPDNDVINLGLGGLQTFQLLPTGFAVPPNGRFPTPSTTLPRHCFTNPMP